MCVQNQNRRLQTQNMAATDWEDAPVDFSRLLVTSPVSNLLSLSFRRVIVGGWNKNYAAITFLQVWRLKDAPTYISDKEEIF